MCLKVSVYICYASVGNLAPTPPPPPTSQAIFHPTAAVYTAEEVAGVGVGVALRVAGKMVDLLRARDWGVSLEERCHSLGVQSCVCGGGRGTTETIWGAVHAQGLEEELPEARRSVTHKGLHSRPI